MTLKSSRPLCRVGLRLHREAPLRPNESAWSFVRAGSSSQPQAAHFLRCGRVVVRDHGLSHAQQVVVGPFASGAAASTAVVLPLPPALRTSFPLPPRLVDQVECLAVPPRPRAPRQRLAIQPAGAIAHRPGQPAAWGRRSARACFASGSSRAGSGTAVFLRACRPWVLCQRLSASGLTQHLRHVQAGSPSGQPRHCCRNRSADAPARGAATRPP